MKAAKKHITLAVGLLLSMGLMACNDSTPAAPETPASPVAEASTQPEASATEASTEASAHEGHAAASENTATAEPAKAGECDIELTGNDAMQFNTKEIVVASSCKDFTINFKHIGKQPKTAMGHNVVVTKTSDINGVVKDAAAAGAAHDFVKEGDERVLAKTKLLGGGESESITLDVAKLKEAPYSYLCTFTGHSGVMRGKIVIK